MRLAQHTSATLLFSLLIFSTTLVAAEPSEEVTKLIVQLKNADETVRLKAAKEIAKYKADAKPAIELLAKIAANDPDEDVRTVAKRSLGTIREAVALVDKDAEKEAVLPYVKALKSKKAAERVKALEDLGQLGEKARPATSGIAEAMLDASPLVREAAIAAMELVDPTIHKHLVCLLVDKDRDNHRDSLIALEKLGSRAKGTLPFLKAYYAANTQKSKRPDLIALKTMVTLAPDDALISSEVLKLMSYDGRDSLFVPGSRDFVDYSTSVAKFKLSLLEKIEVTKQKKVEALIAALALRDSIQRIEMIEQLARYGADAKAALPVLMKLKLDNVAEVRDAATRAVEAIKAE